jgi:hypothetical protein
LTTNSMDVFIGNNVNFFLLLTSNPQNNYSNVSYFTNTKNSTLPQNISNNFTL